MTPFRTWRNTKHKLICNTVSHHRHNNSPTQFPNQNPPNPTYELIVGPSSSAWWRRRRWRVSLCSLSFAFFLPLLELDLLVFLLLGLLVGFCHHRAIAIELKQRSHRPQRPGMNKMERSCGCQDAFFSVSLLPLSCIIMGCPIEWSQGSKDVVLNLFGDQIKR